MSSIWLLHLHIGVRKTPLTVFRTSDPKIVTVLYGKKAWKNINRDEAASIVGRILLRSGYVS
jgi:hypothetical protein